MKAYDDDTPSPFSSRGFVLLCVLVIMGELGISVYDLWRDGQRHRFDVVHIVGLLASLYLTALIGRVAWRAWRKVWPRNAGEPRSTIL